MREIKFRAWNHVDMEMLTQEAMTRIGGYYYSHGVSADDSYSLMQYTGLKDKNGVEIYEDDVVLIHGYGEYICEFPFLELYEAYAENDIGEIQGNIYQQPELLK